LIPLYESLGHPCMIEAKLDGELLRYFHGHVIDACHISEIKGAGVVYRLTLAPLSYFHEHGSEFRIFQNMTIIEIVKKVLGECNIVPKVEGTIGTRQVSFCVQYGESDFAFVCRLLEEEGIYYYYRHSRGGHELTLCDRAASHPAMSPATLTYNPSVETVIQRDSKVRDWKKGTYVNTWKEIASTRGESDAEMIDWDFHEPADPKDHNHEHNEMPFASAMSAIGAAAGGVAQGMAALASLGGSKAMKAAFSKPVKSRQWPARFWDANIAAALGKVLMESQSAQRVRYEAECRYPGVQAGFLFTLQDHPNKGFNKRYLVIDCRTQLADEQYRSGGQTGITMVEFTAIRDKVPYRAPMVTPRPVVRGPETAIVVGPVGEEIYVDKYGRIKVQFHWEAKDKRKKNQDSSCWVRVMQNGLLGTIDHPRIGEEVLIDFVGGNPDRPLVVGRVYNAGNMPIYDLPNHKTKTVIRDKRYKESAHIPFPGAKEVPVLPGTRRGGNEITMESDKANPRLFIYADKYSQRSVVGDECINIGYDQNVDVGHNRTEIVGNDETITIGGKRTETVAKNEKITIDGNRTEKVKGFEKINITGDRKVTTDASNSLTAQSSISIKSKSSTILIKAPQSITLKCGLSSIEMTPEGIVIEAMMIKVKGSLLVSIEGMFVNVRAKALLVLKGLATMIN
jgi:type VI secretion system secreted protein VgrG